MELAAAVTLISDGESGHGVYSPKQTTQRTVRASIRSVYRSEHYEAQSAGMNPSHVFCLRARMDYHGEKTCRWDRKLWRITRTFLTKDGGIELTVERADD